MKSTFKLLFGCLLSGLFLAACTVSNPKFFAGIQPASDPTYGYSPQNPVKIKNGDLETSIASSYYFLSQLRTKNGNKLQLIDRHSVINPNYKRPSVEVTNRYSGKPLNYGSGPMLDYYLLKSEQEADTVRIYINPYEKAGVKIPVGLKFEQ